MFTVNNLILTIKFSNESETLCYGFVTEIQAPICITTKAKLCFQNLQKLSGTNRPVKKPIKTY